MQLHKYIYILICFYSYSSIMFVCICVPVPSVYSVGNRGVTSGSPLKHQEVTPFVSGDLTIVVVTIGLVHG